MEHGGVVLPQPVVRDLNGFDDWGVAGGILQHSATSPQLSLTIPTIMQT